MSNWCPEKVEFSIIPKLLPTSPNILPYLAGHGPLLLRRSDHRASPSSVVSVEAVERSFEEVRCQRRETFMECFHKARPVDWSWGGGMRDRRSSQKPRPKDGRKTGRPGGLGVREDARS